MIDFILMGKAKDIFTELEFMLKLQKALGQVVKRYKPKPDANSQN